MEYLYDGPKDASFCLVLAHGAGAPMDSPFMQHIAEGVARHGVRVARFEFPYMAARRTSNTRRGPDRAPVLHETWLRAIADHRGFDALFIGGKSMGGRYATMVCDEVEVTGVVCLGYPFHPPGKPERVRTQHLAGLQTPTLVVQGTRDALGKRDEVQGYTLSPQMEVVWVEDGDHSLTPTKRSGRTHAQALDDTVSAIWAFMQAQARTR